MPEDFVICSKWPERDRWALREMITELPLTEEPFCADCLHACNGLLEEASRFATVYLPIDK